MITKGMATKPSWPFSAQPEVDDTDDMIYRYIRVDLNCENAESHALEVRSFSTLLPQPKSTQLSSFDGQPAQYQDDARLIESMLALTLSDSTSQPLRRYMYNDGNNADV